MSSSDEELFLLDNIYLKLKRRKTNVHEINRQREVLGEYHHLFKELKEHPDRFHSYARMSLDTFNYVLSKVENKLTKTWCNWHRPILPEERLVVTLRYLVTGSSFHTLAFTFRMGVSTVSGIVAETIVVVWDELQPIHMPVPSIEHFTRVADDFQKIWNFPNCIGAIDGKHVRVKCPDNSGAMFYNYKNFYSVVLQAAVDANYKFITIDVGGYGKQSDGGTFQASDLYKTVIAKTLQVPEPSTLPNSDVVAPYVFVADDAYPLLPFVMKPYSGTNLPLDKECFNKRLSRSRKTVECAFGIMDSKWCILSKRIDTNPGVVDNIIKCICILHNTIIDREGMPHNLTEVSLPSNDRVWEHVGRPANDAKSVRDVFNAYFVQNPIAYNFSLQQ